MPSMFNRRFSSSPPLQSQGSRFVKSQLFTLMMVITALAACSDPGPQNPNQGSNNENTKTNIHEGPDTIQCERGVPSTDGKTCVNSDNCGGNTSACIEGFSCKGSACVAIECGEGKPPCTRGECSTDGLCVSKAVCRAGDAAKACIAGEVCIGTRCEPPKTCDAVGTCGVADAICLARRANCVEATTCTSSDQCQQGRYCHPTANTCEDDKCVTPSGLKDCAAEGGGICNSATGVCENAVACTAASQCIDDTDLTKKQICSDNPGDSSATDKECRTFNTVCGATCRDINRCQYDAANLTLTCGDGSCSTIDECGKSQYCDGSTCQEISKYACFNDSYEGSAGNEDKANATPIATGNTFADLALCANDVDVFVIDDVSAYLTAGKLFVADLQFDEASRGRKVKAKMTVEFVKVDNSTSPPTESVIEPHSIESFRQDTTDPAETHHDDIVFFKRVDYMTDLAKIYVKVEYLSSPDSLGVDYSLKVEAVDENIFELCQNQTQLTFTDTGSFLEATAPAQDLNSAPTLAGSFPAEPACTDTARDIPELAYRFTVPGTKSKKAVIDALPDASSGLDITLVVLKDCEKSILDINPENQSGCYETSGVSSRETYQTILEPGDYTVVVTAKDKASLGNGLFDLTVQLHETTCVPEDVNECSSGNKVTCDSFLTKTETTACPTSDPCIDLGGGNVGCLSDFGYDCANPFVFSKAHPISALGLATSQMKGASPWYNSKFDCGGKIDASLVAMAETYLKTTVPPNHTAVVVVTPPATGGDNFTLYTMKSCSAATCESASARDSAVGVRTLSYKNTGSTAEDIYFVIETESGFGQFTLDAKVVESSEYTVCSPGEVKCDASDPTDQKIQVCKKNTSGDYEFESTSCGAGIACDPNEFPAACEFAGDTCDKPITLQPGLNYTYKLGEYTNTIKRPGGTCPKQNSVGVMQANGTEDIVFRIDPPAGKIAEIEVSPWVLDAVIWQINGDCSVVNTANNCKIGADDGGDGNKEVLRIESDGTPILFVVEGFSVVRPHSKFDIKVEFLEGDCRSKLPKPTCDTSTNKISYCDLDNIKRTEVCANGCSDSPARCNNPTAKAAGSNCANPILLNSATKSNGTESFSLKPPTSYGYSANFSVNGMTLHSGLNGECTVEPEGSNSALSVTEGVDMIYAFELHQDQILEYKVKTDRNNGSMNSAFRVYILDQSCTADGCRNMRDRHFLTTDGKPYEPFPGENYKYYSRATAGSPEIVYLVVDTTRLTGNIPGELIWEIKSNPRPGVTESLYGSHCANDTTVNYIGRDGTTWNSVTCPANTKCKHGACMPVKSGTPAEIVGDVCNATIAKITAPALFVLESSQTADLVESTNAAAPISCGGANIDASGADYFFTIDVPAGEMLTVRGISAGFSAPTVYIAENCNKLNANGTDACLAGVQGAGGRYYAKEDHAVVEYYNSTGAVKTVTVGLDSSVQATDVRLKEAFYYMVDLISSPACTTPGVITCGLDSSNQARLMRCLGGQLEAVPGGECESNQCLNTFECKSEGNSAEQAVELTKSATEQTTASNNDLSKRRDTSDSLVKTNAGGDSLVYGSCPFMKKPVGPDYYYAIELAEGDYLQATLKKGDAPNAGKQKGMLFYLLAPDKKTCITLTQPAMHGAGLSASRGELPLNFQAFEAGRYYLVVDNFNESVAVDESAFKITYSVESKGANDCVKYATQCKNGTDELYICDEGGHAAKVVGCPYGCIGRACRTESTSGSYDICSTSDTAIESARLFIYDEDSSVLNRDYTFTGKPPCGELTSNNTAATDLFVKVKLKDKEYLKISDYRSYYTFGPAYSIMEAGNCTAGTYFCEAGDRVIASPNDDPNKFRSTVLDKYISNGVNEVYLGVTTASQSSTYARAGLFYVEFMTATCNPGAATCNTSGSTASVTYCTDVNQPATTYACSANACNGSVCQVAATNAGDTPLAPIDLDTTAAWTTDNSTNVRTGVLNGSTDGRENSYGSTSSNNDGGCPDYTVNKTPGRDVFHKVTLQPGEKLDVDLKRTSTAGVDHSVYLYRSATANLTPTRHAKPFPFCFAGKDGSYSQATETISYTYPAGSKGPADFLIVADAYDTITTNDHYEYELTVKITPAP